MSLEVRVRFAPSPTGFLHVGNARTALYNWLWVRHLGGKFVLRIEDTDKERSTQEYEKAILEDLKWLGLDWDEGPDVGGNFKPYRQSEKSKRYQEALTRLTQKDLAYRCYCTQEELKKRREEALAQGKPPKYDNRCRNLSEDQKAQYQKENRPFVWRFKVPEKRTISFKDIVRGEVSFECETIGDFVIFKSDGGPTFHFSVVCDDADMKISHVIRGEDHLSNTPKHILLFEAIEAPIPQFAHLPLILGSDRAPLSKRHGMTSIRQYHELDFIPEALVNYLSLLGWAPGDDQEIFTKEELTQKFTLERINKSAAIFDESKFQWVCAQHMNKKSVAEIMAHSEKFVLASGFVSTPMTPEQKSLLEKAISIIRAGLRQYNQVPDLVRVFFKDELEIDINQEEGRLAYEELRKPNVAELLKKLIEKLEAMPQLSIETLKADYKELQKETGLKGKGFFMPIRVAITGEVHGPELNELIPVLGKEKLIQRLEGALTRYCE